MKVRDLIRDLFELPQDDILNIQYFHEDSQGKRIDCDIHDLLIGSGTLKGHSYLEIIGREDSEDE